MNHNNDVLYIDVSVEDQNEIGMSLQESEQINISVEKVMKTAGSGVSDYEKLHNLPTIDGTEIKGEVKEEIEKLFPKLPSWAQQPEPPVYTADDVGAVSKESFNTELEPIKNKIAANSFDIDNLDKELQNKADVSLIPVVNNGKLTFQINGEDIESFFANQKSDAVVNLSIPVKISDLFNDSNFAVVESPVFTGVPKAPTASSDTNNTQIATTAFVKQIVNALVGTAPETLDTLGEVADAIKANQNVIAALNAAIGTKVSKEEGKGLSTNDLTNELLAEINTHEQNVQANWNETNASSDAFIKNKPQSLPASDVYEWAKQPNKPTYKASEVGALPNSASEEIDFLNQQLEEVSQNLLSLSNAVDELNSKLGNVQIYSITRHAYSVSIDTGTKIYSINLLSNSNYAEYINTGYVPYILNANVYSEGTYAVENIVDFGPIDDNKIRVLITSGRDSTVTITVRVLVLWSKIKH